MNLLRDHQKTLRHARARAWALLLLFGLLLSFSSYIMRMHIKAKTAAYKKQNAEVVQFLQAQQEAVDFAQRRSELLSQQDSNKKVLAAMNAMREFQYTGINFKKIIFTLDTYVLQSSQRRAHFKELPGFTCWQQQPGELLVFHYIC